MKLIATTDAVGHVLCHDMTQIIRGVSKDARFRKGHVVEEADIPVLLSMGKEQLYVYETAPGMLHENDAAMVLKDISLNDGMTASEPKEGKISLKAAQDGLFTIRREALFAVNCVGDMMIASRHGDTPVRSGDELAGMRVIPLLISEEKMREAKAAAGDTPIFALLPFVRKRAGLIVTGSEVYHGRIDDTFSPVILEKLSALGIEVGHHVRCNDRVEDIVAEINAALAAGCDMVICTGGMSVDPDDRTPAAIAAVAEDVVTYGAPVLPGAMFMLAYTAEGVPVMGLPGCVMYAGRTIFDLVLPQVAADRRMQPVDFSSYGEGGLCLNCAVCTFPNCGFGKGR